MMTAFMGVTNWTLENENRASARRVQDGQRAEATGETVAASVAADNDARADVESPSPGLVK
jgi:hypothetical protein